MAAVTRYHTASKYVKLFIFVRGPACMSGWLYLL